MIRTVVLSCVVLISSLLVINGQSIHFCQALKDNNWTISYGFGIPNGTYQKKIIVIKDNYWELEYDSAGDPTGNPKKTVFLTDVFGKKSDFFSGQYDMGFSARRYSVGDWTQNFIGLFNLKTKTIDWVVVDPNLQDFNGLTKKSVTTDFGGFRPQVTYNTISRMHFNTIIFMEQTRSGQPSPKFNTRLQAYYTLYLNKSGLINETDAGWFVNTRKVKKYIVTPSLKEVPNFWKIKALFGIKVIEHGALGGDNSTLFLIESCTDINEDPCVKSQVVYRYCILDEKEDQPIDQTACHPGKVINNVLVDCSNPADWLPPTNETSSAVNTTDKETTDVSVAETVAVIDVSVGSSVGSSVESEETSNAVTAQRAEQKTNGREKGKGWLWIIIIIIIILAILLLALCFFFGVFGKKKTDSKDTAKDSGAQGPTKSLKSSSNSVRSQDAKGAGGPGDPSGSAAKGLNKSLAMSSNQMESIRSNIGETPSSTKNKPKTNIKKSGSLATPSTLDSSEIRSKI